MSLRRFAQLVLAVNLAVIVWGGYVRASGSGAGCGRHWPLCNGTVVPREPALETIVELTHRVTSGVALLLVAALTVMAFRATRPGHRLRKAAGWSAFFILTEAAVGAALVLLELVGGNDSALRAGYLAVHLTNTFCLLGFLTLTMLWADRPAPTAPAGHRDLRRLAWGSLAALMLVGMTGAVTALGDTLFPAETLRAGIAQDLSETAHFLVRLRVIHPALAVLGALLVGFVAWRTIARAEAAAAHGAARWLLALVVLQIGVGVVNLLLLAPIGTQLLHLLMADLVWIAAVAVLVQLGERPAAPA